MPRSISRDIPGPDWRIWPEARKTSSWREIFCRRPGAPLRLNVDIGFGRGEFITELTRQDPDAAFVGVDLSFKRVLKLARRISKTDVTNLRLLCVPAEWAIREVFEELSVETAWINFPDPWPKRRHRGRRLVDPRFIAVLTSRLVAGGALRVATDNPVYAETIGRVLDATPGLVNAHAPRAWLSQRPETLSTAYEQQWRSHGSHCYFFHYRRDVASSDGTPS